LLVVVVVVDSLAAAAVQAVTALAQELLVAVLLQSQLCF
jgi:hypothetical protein